MGVIALLFSEGKISKSRNRVIFGSGTIFSGKEWTFELRQQDTRREHDHHRRETGGPQGDSEDFGLGRSSFPPTEQSVDEHRSVRAAPQFVLGGLRNGSINLNAATRRPLYQGFYEINFVSQCDFPGEVVLVSSIIPLEYPSLSNPSENLWEPRTFSVTSHGQPVSEPCGLTLARLARLSDEEVMAHIQGGHDDALAVLFDRYHRLVASVAYKILRDMGEAEDVTQVVFLNIFEASAQFDPSRGTTRVWLMQYAYHRAMNRRAYLHRRKFYEPNDESVCDLTPASNPKQVNGGTLLVLQEIQSLVREGLEALSGPQRQTLQMAYFEGLSLKEIAEKTGDSFGNVRHHYYRGLVRMREFVSQGSPGGNGKSSHEVVRRGTVDVKA